MNAPIPAGEVERVSDEALPVWNKLGLIAHNGTVTLSVRHFNEAVALAAAPKAPDAVGEQWVSNGGDGEHADLVLAPAVTRADVAMPAAIKALLAWADVRAQLAPDFETEAEIGRRFIALRDGFRAFANTGGRG